MTSDQAIRVPVTRAELAAARAKHVETLVHAIRDCGAGAPPADGALERLVAGLRILDQIIPIDEVTP